MNDANNQKQIKRLTAQVANLQRQLEQKERQLANLAGRGGFQRFLMGSASEQIDTLNSEIATLKQSIENIGHSIARMN